VLDGDGQIPIETTPNGLTGETVAVPDAALLRSIVEAHRPDLEPFADFYRKVHQDPEISGMEVKTAQAVANNLQKIGYEVYAGIGGHGVAGVFRNGPGKTVLMRAELDALPILEQTDVPYRSEKRMVDRYGNERPVMHACGHDMNMAALLASAALLRASAEWWAGTIVVVFQPDEEETGGARAMIEDGLYDHIPVPDLMLGQHVVPSRSGTIAIRSGPVLTAADSVHIRVIGGPCEGSTNPQLCVDPIPLAMRTVLDLQDAVRKEISPDEEATVTCWEFHAGEPGNDYVAYADILLDIKTVKPDVRRRILALVERRFREDCRSAGVPTDPVFNFTVRAPLTTNDDVISGAVSRVFDRYFAADSISMSFTSACEDFSTLGAPYNVPYAYWNFGGTSPDADEPVAINHSPYFAPVIYPTLQVGTDAMALAVLAFVAC